MPSTTLFTPSRRSIGFSPWLALTCKTGTKTCQRPNACRNTRKATSSRKFREIRFRRRRRWTLFGTRIIVLPARGLWTSLKSVCAAFHITRNFFDSISGICEDCRSNSSLASYQMLSKTHLAVKRASDLQRVCASCGRHSVHQQTECDSAECPVFYARAAANAEVEETSQNSLEVAKIWKRQHVQHTTVKIEDEIL